jgi:hypothetical protein
MARSADYQNLGAGLDGNAEYCPGPDEAWEIEQRYKEPYFRQLKRSG